MKITVTASNREGRWYYRKEEAEIYGDYIFDLLKALQELCYQGRAQEIDDSTYLVLG